MTTHVICQTQEGIIWDFARGIAILETAIKQIKIMEIYVK